MATDVRHQSQRPQFCSLRASRSRSRVFDLEPLRRTAGLSTSAYCRFDQPASLNASLFGSKRDRKIAASIGSLKQYRTYAAHSSSTYMSNLPAYNSRKFMISLSAVSCRRGSTTWYGHSSSSFCSQALRLSGSMITSVCQRFRDRLFSVCSISVKRQQMKVANVVNTSLIRDLLLYSYRTRSPSEPRTLLRLRMIEQMPAYDARGRRLVNDDRHGLRTPIARLK
jgi:hypothetical protein